MFSMANPLKVEPPDRAEIGRAAWRYLHSLAAQFPTAPRKSEAKEAQAPGRAGNCGCFSGVFHVFKVFPGKIDVFLDFSWEKLRFS